MQLHGFFSLLMVLLLGVFNNKAEHKFEINGYAQGTTYHISYWALDSLVSKHEVELLLAQLDSSLSIYKPYSLISRFNDDPIGIRADAHLSSVVKRSLEIFEDTQGKFDITVYPLVNAWGFGGNKISVLPDSARIASLLPCVGSNNLKFSNGVLTKSFPCVKIDVNGIAQGYSVDVVANFLAEKGIRNYIVEIGGELIAAGRKPNGEGMKIGIESPSTSSAEESILSKIITIKDAAVTTSGSYRKFIESGKKRFIHLIDPKTGYPIKSDMVSVTLIAKDAITADGYDNAMMAMTVSEAIAFADLRSLPAHFIYQQPNGKLADTATASFYRLISVPSSQN